MQIFLEIECLLQQQFTLDNVDNLLELDSDVEVRRYLDMPTPPTRTIVVEHTLPLFMALGEPTGWLDRSLSMP